MRLVGNFVLDFIAVFNFLLCPAEFSNPVAKYAVFMLSWTRHHIWSCGIMPLKMCNTDEFAVCISSFTKRWLVMAKGINGRSEIIFAHCWCFQPLTEWCVTLLVL